MKILIDYPKSGEAIGKNYSVNIQTDGISHSSTVVHVLLKIDEGEGQPCHARAGRWWFEWKEIPDGPHTLRAEGYTGAPGERIESEIVKCFCGEIPSSGGKTASEDGQQEAIRAEGIPEHPPELTKEKAQTDFSPTLPGDLRQKQKQKGKHLDKKVPAVLWAEYDLVRFPFALLEKRRTKRNIHIEVVRPSGKLTYNATAAKPEFNLPGEAGITVLRALDHLCEKQGRLIRVFFSFYEIRELTGLSFHSIFQTIMELSGVAISSDNAIYNPAEDRWMVKADKPTGILSASIEGRGHPKSPRTYEKAWVEFSNWYWASLVARKVRRLPFWELQISGRAARAWEVLSSKPSHGTQVRFTYEEFCRWIPLEPEKFPSKAHHQLTGIFAGLEKKNDSTKPVVSWELLAQKKPWIIQVKIDRRVAQAPYKNPSERRQQNPPLDISI